MLMILPIYMKYIMIKNSKSYIYLQLIDLIRKRITNLQEKNNIFHSWICFHSFLSLWLFSRLFFCFLLLSYVPKWLYDIEQTSSSQQCHKDGSGKYTLSEEIPIDHVEWYSTDMGLRLVFMTLKNYLRIVRKRFIEDLSKSTIDYLIIFIQTSKYIINHDLAIQVLP